MNFHRIVKNCSGKDSCCSSHTHYPLIFKLIVAGVLLCLAGGQAQADPISTTSTQQGVEIATTLSTTKVRVAEPFTLTYELIAPSGKSLVWPTIANQLGPFDVIDSQDLFDIPVETGRMWRRTLTLESIQTGDLEIPALAVNVVEANSTGATAESLQVIEIASQPITITSVLEGRADPTQFRDIQSVVDVVVPEETSSTWTLWGFAGIGGIAIVCAALAVLAFRVRSITPENWALQQLEDLSARIQQHPANSSEHVSELTDIIKHYLFLQFDIPASQQTTDELSKTLATANIGSPAHRGELIDVLTLADEAKFAGVDLNAQALQTAIQSVQNYVSALAEPIAEVAAVQEAS